MSKPGNTGIKRILLAAVYSVQGFRHAWKYEAAFRQEIVLILILIPVAFWLGQTTLERVLLIGVCFVVLITELLNSAVEAAIDRFGGEQHELSGRAKDLASAAVFVSMLLVLLVWAAVIYDRFVAQS